MTSSGTTIIEAKKVDTRKKIPSWVLWFKSLEEAMKYLEVKELLEEEEDISTERVSNLKRKGTKLMSVWRT